MNQKNKPNASLFHLLQRFPMELLRAHARKKTIQKFAESVGLVYFGYVDQHSDEHELVRGFSVSVEHRDNHYCVGSMYGHDVIIVERTDTIRFPDKPSQKYSWIILQIDLHHDAFPHIFLSPMQHSETFYANFFIKYAHFQKLDVSLWRDHDPSFASQFSMFGSLHEQQAIADVFTVDTTTVVAHNFQGLECELVNDRLLLYASNQHVTTHLLEKMCKNGLWLAGQLDAMRRIEKG